MQKRILIFLSIILILTIGTVFLNFGAVKATDQSSKPTDIILKMKDLKNKVETKHLKAGWIHFANKQSVNYSNGGNTLPDGTVIPNDYIMESYWHLDKDFIPYEGVSFMKSLDGQVIQTSILKDKKWKSDDVPSYDPSVPNLDWGAVQYVEQVFNSDMTTKAVRTSAEETTFNDQAAQFFEITSDYETPIDLVDFNQPVKSFVHKLYFSLDGQLLQWQSVVILEDESEVTGSRSYDFTIESGITPPSEVLAYLK